MKTIAGIDIGAGYTKCVIIDQDGKILNQQIGKTNPDFESSASDLINAIYSKKEERPYIITTGVGRYSISFRNIQITDITATAKAVNLLMPDVEFALDIGWQVTRAIRISHEGKVKDFKCNEKCAAGSGSFIERASKYLEIEMDKIGELSSNAKDPQPISSICAVLAESEIINHISEGKTVDNILRGIHNSLADRSLMLLKRVGFDHAKCAFIGGLALQKGMVEALNQKIGSEVIVPPNPRFVTAYGAALMGLQRLRKTSDPAFSYKTQYRII